MTTSRSKKTRTSEILATSAGIAGAAWLALGASHPALGWGAFLVSNIAWILVSCDTGIKGLGIQHLAYMATSLYGLIRTS